MPQNPSAQSLSEIYAVLGTNETGQEGVASFIHPQTLVMTPLIGGRARLDELKTYGSALAISSGRTLTLVKFSSRTSLEQLHPDSEDDDERYRAETEDD